MNPGSNQPALSLVFPVFDEAENLGPLLTSALQTAARLTPDFEIVLVDDGSGDGSRQLIDRWCRQHGRIRAVYHETNGGYGSALRSGLREARGPAEAHRQGLVGRHFAVDEVADPPEQPQHGKNLSQPSQQHGTISSYTCSRKSTDSGGCITRAASTGLYPNTDTSTYP